MLDRTELEATLLAAGTCFRYPRNAIILVQGTRGHNLFYVREGLVKCSFLTAEGREKILQYAGRGEILGESGILNERGFGVTAMAVTPVEVITLTRERTLQLLRCSSSFAEFIIESLSVKLWTMGLQLFSDSFFDAGGRVAKALLTLSATGTDGKPMVEITHQELSKYVGANRVTVTRLLRELENAGLVECARAHIRVRDREALKRWAMRRER